MNKIKFYLKAFMIEKLSGMILRNEGRSLLPIFKRLAIVMGGSITPGLVRTSLLVFKEINLISNQQGLPGVVKYLKVAAVVLQQTIAGHYTKDLTELGPRIARTRTGLPRIIPAHHRALIRMGNPFMIKYYLTIFSIYRNIIIPYKIKVKTITAPFSGNPQIFGILDKYIPIFNRLFVNPDKLLKDNNKQSFNFRWNPKKSFESIYEISSEDKIGLATKYLSKYFMYFPINKSSPNTLGRGEVSTSIRAMLRSLWTLSLNKEQGTALMTVLDRVNPNRDLARFWYNFYKSYIKIQTMVPEWLTTRPYLGKLGLKGEAAGKLRVFAMVDPITQWSLAPLHKFLFRILSKHIMDGTFDQLKPIGRAWRFKSLYSLDLSAATDRLPMQLQKMLLKDLFKDPEFVDSWATLLVSRPYQVPRNKYTSLKEVYYAVGQPMGALSSWAMLAYTHHFIVQCAAWRSGIASQSSLYRDYAVLGDDIVIFNKTVAKEYLNIIKLLGVECGLAKSVLSPKGVGLEFAKKTFYKGNNVSPTPLLEFSEALLSWTTFKNYCLMYKLSFAKSIRVSGAGYKVLGGLNKPLHRQNSVVRTLKLLWTIPSSLSEMEALYTSLNRLGGKVPLNQLIGEYIKLYFTSFYKKVLSLAERLDQTMFDSETHLINEDESLKEIGYQLYLKVYFPYFSRFKAQILRISQDIVRTKLHSHIGVWRLYSQILQWEKELSSLSLDLFQAKRSDVISRGGQARQIRFYRSVSSEIGKFLLTHKATKSIDGKPSVIGKQSLNLKLVEAKLNQEISIKDNNNNNMKTTNTSSSIDEVMMGGFGMLPMIVIQQLISRLPRKAVWPILKRVGRQVVGRVVIKSRKIIVISFAYVIRKIFLPMLIYLMIIPLIIVLIIGLLSLPHTDFMWETDVSQHTSRALCGFIELYYQESTGNIETIHSQSVSYGWWDLGIILMIIFSLITGALWFDHRNILSYAVGFQHQMITDMFIEHAGNWGQAGLGWVEIPLTGIFVNLNYFTALSMWIQFFCRVSYDLWYDLILVTAIYTLDLIKFVYIGLRFTEIPLTSILYYIELGDILIRPYIFNAFDYISSIWF